MNYAINRNERLLTAFLAATILWSMSMSVIAQEKYKEAYIPTYKVKLALANLPPIRLISERETDKTDPGTTLINLNKKQAGLTISSNENGLLVSYLKGKHDFLKSNSLFDTTSPTNETVIKPIAFLSAPIITEIPGDEKWKKAIKEAYRGGLVRTVAPGVKHITVKRHTKAGPIVINVVEANWDVNKNISIEPALAGTKLPSTNKVSHMVKRNNAVAGINASFFKQTTGVPLGSLIINEEIMTGPIYNRVTLGIGDREFKMARISLNGRLIRKDGTEITINNVNQPRMLSAYTLIYSDKWGKLAPPSPQYGIQVAIKDGKVIAKSKNRLEIPEEGYVIVGPEKNLAKLNVDEPIEIKFSTTPDWTGIKHAVSGGPYLVKEGQIYVDTTDQKLGSIGGINPRTAVGYTQDNRFIMVTIDGRQKGSVGVSLNELARIMKNFGCYNAMNLDGGTSTQMFVKNQVVNRPLYKGGAYVGSALIVKVNE